MTQTAEIQKKDYQFRSSKGLFKIYTYTLIAMIIASIGILWLMSNMFIDIANLVEGKAELEDTILDWLYEGGEGKMFTIIGIVAVTVIAYVIVHLNVVYRTAKNAVYFNDGNPIRYRPGWCVGWHFVPIFHLWKPFYCLNDIYYATINKDYKREDFETNKLLSVFKYFMILFIFYVIGDRIVEVFLGRPLDNEASVMQMQEDGTYAGALKSYAKISALFAIFSLLSAYYGFKSLKLLVDTQEERENG